MKPVPVYLVLNTNYDGDKRGFLLHTLRATAVEAIDAFLKYQLETTKDGRCWAMWQIQGFAVRKATLKVEKVEET